MSGLIIFYSFIGLCVIFLFAVNVIAKKYLNGDYFDVVGKKEEEDDYDDDDEEDVMPHQRFADAASCEILSPQGCVDAASCEIPSPMSALAQITEEGSPHPFASHARIRVTFQYQEVSNLIIGCVISIDGLSSYEPETDPSEISFHVTLLSNRLKYKKRMKWRAGAKPLALSFILGPFKGSIDPNGKICIRVYGKSKSCIARALCYGECAVPLRGIMETEEEGPLEFDMCIMPKAESTIDTKTTSTVDTEYESTVEASNVVVSSTDADQ